MTQLWADISGWQPDNPNFSSLSGVVIKSTEGTGFVNPHLDAQRNNAKSAGLELAYYHYADGFSPIDEANWFISQTGRKDGEAQALDLEGDIVKNLGAGVVQWTADWAKTVIDGTGNTPGLYINQNVLTSFDWGPVLQLNLWLWIAEWNGQNSPQFSQWPVWTLWQYADTNISGGDSDYFNGDLATFQAIAKNTADPVPAPTPAPTPAPAPAPTPAPVPVGGNLYTVVSGDSLSGIAERYGISLAELEALNPQIPNFDLIYPGQVINVPGGNPAPAPAPVANTYVVQSGDSLSAIADRFGISLGDLEAMNPQIPNFDLIYPGQVINV